MENNIKFKIGDIVCEKITYHTPLGVVTNNLNRIVPFVIEYIIPDKLYEDRVGEIGCANEYRLRHPIHGHSFIRYQYELMLWSEIKDQVIAAREAELEVFKSL